MSVIDEIAAERRRQIKAEGWTAKHDDEHVDGSLAEAACCYAMAAAYPEIDMTELGAYPVWPWHRDWWKPTTARRNLVKAAALIVAEIERLDRAAPQHPEGPTA